MINLYFVRVRTYTISTFSIKKKNSTLLWKRSGDVYHQRIRTREYVCIFDEKCEREWIFQSAMSCSYDAQPSLEHIPLSQPRRQPPRSDSHSQNHRLTPPLHATFKNEYDNCDSQVNYSSYSISFFICFFCFISPVHYQINVRVNALFIQFDYL